MTVGRGTSSRSSAGSRTLTVSLTARAKRALRTSRRLTIRLATDLNGSGTPVSASQKIAVSR